MAEPFAALDEDVVPLDPKSDPDPVNDLVEGAMFAPWDAGPVGEDEDEEPDPFVGANDPRGRLGPAPVDAAQKRSGAQVSGTWVRGLLWVVGGVLAGLLFTSMSGGHDRRAVSRPAAASAREQPLVRTVVRTVIAPAPQSQVAQRRSAAERAARRRSMHRAARRRTATRSSARRAAQRPARARQASVAPRPVSAPPAQVPVAAAAPVPPVRRVVPSSSRRPVRASAATVERVFGPGS